MYLQDFHVIRPDYETSQEKGLEWIVAAQLKAKMQSKGWEKDQVECREFSEKLRDHLFKLGLGEKKIAKRATQIPDFFHENWEEMEIYNLNEKPEGFHLDKRMEFFRDSALKVFERMYPVDHPLPSYLIHVTCTGYVAPSPAQSLVSLRSGGKQTMVTHAYHMGCYGAISSIRMAMGNYALEEKETDIVHTEFCTLHLNPSQHSTEQLVVQSLFADGFIKYTLKDGKGPGPKLRILGILEEIIEDTREKMSWNCNPWGFQMTISKDIPILLRKNLEGFLERLAKRAKIDGWEKARFAIHPGGPKIIAQIAEKLNLQPEQIRHSEEVLKNCGNMSSATLPHIWDLMLKDPEVKVGEKIVGLAFGPGLSFCGCILEKRGE